MKRNRMKIGGHNNYEHFEHYHLLIKKPTGSVKEICELFKDAYPEFGITAGTISHVRRIVENDEEKIRDIEVNGEKFKLYKPDNIPIEIILLPK
jgi:hypothetical protein